MRRPTGRGGHPAGKVLVLGKDTRSFLSAVRSLGRQGIEVHAAWCTPGLPELRSRYLSRVHAVLPPGEGNDGWLDDLAALLSREGFDLVLPTNDPAVVALQERRGELEPLARIHLLGERAYRVCYDKAATRSLADSLGIPVPREMCVDSPVQPEEVFEVLGRRLVLKPRASFAFGRRKWEHQVRKAATARQLSTYLEALLRQGEVLIQERCPGHGVGVELLALEGELLMAFQHRRVHEPLEGGGSSYRVSVPLDPELLEASSALARALEYTGVGMFEFRQDPRTGSWVLLEINARFWGSLPLAVACGADFPFALYQLLVEGRREFPREYRTGLFCRNLLMDSTWLWRGLRAERSDPDAAGVSIPHAAAEALNLLRLRERWDTLARDDPAPALAELRRMLSIYGEALGARLRRVPHRFAPWRSRRSRAARRALDRAGRVLFVCKGNICRSPFADILVRNLLPDATEVASAGYYPHDGRCCPENAVLAAQEFDVDLSQHRSRLLHRRDIDRADVVLLFDEQNRTRLLQDYPFASAKLHLLGIVLPKGSYLIEDPFSGSQAVFHETYARITEAVTSLFSQVRTEHCKYHGAC